MISTTSTPTATLPSRLSGAFPPPWVAPMVIEDPLSLASEFGVCLSPRPGVAFAYRDKMLYFSSEQRTLLELDPIGFAAVSALLAGGSAAQAVAVLSRHGLEVGDTDVRNVIREFSDAGLLRVSDDCSMQATIQGKIRGLLQHQPMKLMMFMTQSCNLRCKYCYGIEGNYEDRGQKMSVEMARASVDHLFDRSPGRSHYYLYFFGGEPLLNFEVMQFSVAYASDRAKNAGKTVEFGVTTNGTLFTDERVDFLIEHDFQIAVSVDGDELGHDVNRPTKSGAGSHRHVLRGLKKLAARIRRPDQLKIRATMSHQNHDVDRISRYIQGLGLAPFGIGSAIPRVGAQTSVDLTESDILELDAQFEALFDSLLAWIEKGMDPQFAPVYNPFFRTLSSFSSGLGTPNIGCGLNRNDLAVDTSGKLYPCHRYVGLEQWVVGHVHSGVDPTRAKEVYGGFYRMWEEHCRGCWARYACSGACAWQHSHDDGAFRRPQKPQCESIRRNIMRTAWFSIFLSQQHPDVWENLSEQTASYGACRGCSSATC